MSENEPMDTTNILIVDDEEDIDVLTKQRFRKEIQSQEYNFFFARNGYEALSCVEREANVDILVTDVNMPQMSGFELLQKIKEKHPSIKTVIISAYSDAQSLHLAEKGGASAFISKPLDFKDLQAILKKLGKNP
ncbi:MAG: response regulator [Alphaproteobacteria bacterium]|nr:response regulator [Alphaproteobacteria bacterium]